VQGKARREAARRRKINLSSRNSPRGNGSRPMRSGDWLAAQRPMFRDAGQSPPRAVRLLPLLREEFRLHMA